MLALAFVVPFAATLDEWVADIVASAGALGVGFLILVENLFPPIPSELILPLAGFSVSRGELAYVAVVLAATAGSVLGALILYAVARLGGRPLILRYGRVVRLDVAALDRADARFDRHADVVVFAGRLVPGLRSLVSVPAGLAEMPLVRFVVLTTLGSAIWNAALIGAGWALGSQYTRVAAVIGPVSAVVLVVTIAAIAAGTVYALRRRSARLAAERRRS